MGVSLKKHTVSETPRSTFVGFRPYQEAGSQLFVCQTRCWGGVGVSQWALGWAGCQRQFWELSF